MPAEKFTYKAKTKADKKQWARVYASAKKSGDPAGTAVRKANGVIAKKKKGSR